MIEEAPRVIGIDVLTSRNDNIYSTIAKEGRKFKVGFNGDYSIIKCHTKNNFS